MELTSANLVTLKAAILAETDAEFVALRAANATGAMAEWYQGVLVPNQLAWSKNVAAQVADEAPDYASFDSLAQGKRDSWARFLAFPRDFSRNKVRKWVVDVWGAAIASSNAEAILLAGTRKALRGEWVFGATTKTTGTVSAADLTLEGVITNTNIVDALR